MGFIRFLSALFKPSVRKSSINDATVGVAGDHSAIENLYIFQNPHHLTNQKDLESEIRQYCQKADSFHSLIPLAGFKTRVKVPIDLDQIYVPLRAVMDTRTTGQSCFGGAEEADCFFKERGEGLEIPLTQAFKEAEKAKRTGIIILGDPGSGKTTHLKRLLLWCLRGNLEKMGLPRDMIPVFLPLRELKNTSKGLSAFIEEQLNHRHLDTPAGFGKRMLERQNLLLLFDGLDEIPDEDDRADISRWIEDAQSLFPKCYFVVTSRFAGYKGKVQMSGNFLEMHIRPLDEDDAQRFIRNWYAIMETAWQKDKSQARDIAGKKADSLIHLLKQPEYRSRKVFHLTRNPLLLANICLIHQSRGNLPRTRARLYEECIDILLELWRDAIGFKTRIDTDIGKRVLQPAALWLHEQEGRTKANANELAKILEPAIHRYKWPYGNALDFLAAVRDDSGLLTEWGNHEFGFMHLGFQEYLAAREIRKRFFEARAEGRDTSVLRDLAGRLHESWWQEVGLLLLALEEPSLFVPFMEEVIKAPVFLSAPQVMDLCIDDAVEVSSRPFEQFLQTDSKNDPEYTRRCHRVREVLRQIEVGIQGSQNTLSAAVLENEKQTALNHDSARAKEIQAPRGGYVLVRIPGGRFLMGSPDAEKDRDESEGPCHRVNIPEFYIGKFPVTNEEYGSFLETFPDREPPKFWSDRQFSLPNQPVVGVSFEDAMAYAAWSGLELPSEAQWEYACRAGTQTRYYTGDTEGDLDRAGWYNGNSEGRLHSVGQKEPNAFGLFDMHGNVFEWVVDQWHNSYIGAPDDGSPWLGLENNAIRVIRGGSWGVSAGNCRAASRNASPPGSRNGNLGFRLVLPGQQ